jgi:hypothetical protein
MTLSVPAFGRWLVGDTEANYMLEVNPSGLDEVDDPLIATLESAPAKEFPNRVRVSRADFDFVTGVGVATGTDPIETDPTVMLSWSDDGGQTWSNPWNRKLETFVDPETGQVREVWYRYLQENVNALNANTTAIASVTTATTFAQTILATTTASGVQSILGYVTADTVGSWTPTVLVGTTAVNSYALQAGRYVQSPNGMVQIWGTVQVSSLTGTTGPISIGGLPVKASSTTAGLTFSGCMGAGSGFILAATLQALTCRITTGSTLVEVGFWSDAGAGFASFPSTRLTTAASMSISVSYETTV